MSRILVVEDNEPNRILVRQILDHAGHEVLEATNGSLCLQIISIHKPELVLMDLQMPIMDGYGALKELRNLPEFASTKVIAVTAYAMKGDREKAIAAGFAEYITKPIDTRMLLSIVNNILNEVKS